MFPQIFFTFADYWWFYGIFTVFVLVVVFVDLGLFHRKATEPSFKNAIMWSLIWISLALIFNVLFYFYASHTALEWFLQNPQAIPAGSTAQDAAFVEGKHAGLEFLGGFVLEKVLAFDNIFAFVLIFKFFGTPLIYQHRVLFFGILGALILRALFIASGSWLLQFGWVAILFGVFLIFTGIKFVFIPQKPINPDENILVRYLRKTNRVSSLGYEALQGRFFVKERGKWCVSILLLALLFIEISDIVFALDSVPAIFALTDEPFIVYTSNIFAILGLRALYFVLAKTVDMFDYLKYGLALILVFIGLKMALLNEMFAGKFPLEWSLGLIFGLLIVSIGASVVGNMFKKRA
jgi:tellurite resistance protein TerC